MNSEIGQLRSRRITISSDESLEDGLKISPNLTPEFDHHHHHQEIEGKISDFPYEDGGNNNSIKTNEDVTVTDKKKKKKKTSVSTPPGLIAQDETAKIYSLPSLGQLDATADDDEDGFKTPTDLAHRIPPPTECPPAPKIKKRPYDSPVNSAARPRRCRRKLVFDGVDLMGRLKIQEDEDKGISAP